MPDWGRGRVLNLAFKTLTFMQGRKHPITARQFAKYMEISKRTAMRYLQAVCDVPESGIEMYIDSRLDSAGLEYYFIYRGNNVRR